VLSTGSMIRLWRAEGSSEFTSETIDIPGGGRRRTVCPAFSPCGLFLSIAYCSPRSREGSGTRIDLYELETMLKSQSVVLPGLSYVRSAFSPDSKQLVVCDGQGWIRILQTDDFSFQRDLNTGRGGRCVTFDPTSRVLAIGAAHGGSVQLWNITY
jgi:WD40 repeat protein